MRYHLGFPLTAKRYYRHGKKPPTPDHKWRIIHLNGTPAKTVGYAEAPGADTAIKKAIEEFKIELRYKNGWSRSGGARAKTVGFAKKYTENSLATLSDVLYTKSKAALL
jgi:hypothetical protein